MKGGGAILHISFQSGVSNHEVVHTPVSHNLLTLMPCLGQHATMMGSVACHASLEVIFLPNVISYLLSKMKSCTGAIHQQFHVFFRCLNNLVLPALIFISLHSDFMIFCILSSKFKLGRESI